LYDWFPTFPNNTKILTNAFNEAIPAVLESTIVPIFRAFLTIQLQGLLILQSSWDKTAQSNRLQEHVANISSQVREMESFYDKLIAKADTMVDEVTTYGKPLPTYVKDAWADDVHLEGHTLDQVRPNNMIACRTATNRRSAGERHDDRAGYVHWLDTGTVGLSGRVCDDSEDAAAPRRQASHSGERRGPVLRAAGHLFRQDRQRERTI
jgi:hypothetical protein